MLIIKSKNAHLTQEWTPSVLIYHALYHLIVITDVFTCQLLSATLINVG